MHKKNSFLTFCFAFIPGAGQMYQGYMKRGVSLMGLFALVSFVAGFMRMGFLTFALPVIWFYAFFDTFNIKGMTEQDRAQRPDAFLLDMNGVLNKDWQALLRRRHGVVGWLCIFLGAYLIFINFVEPWMWQLREYMPWLVSLIDSLPTLVVAVLVIVLGVFLLKGRPAKDGQDFIEYKGGQDEYHDDNQ